MVTNELSKPKRRHRIFRSEEFKALMVSKCLGVGVSTTAIAREHNINPNLLQRWVRAFERSQATSSQQQVIDGLVHRNDQFIELPFNDLQQSSELDTTLELELQLLICSAK